MKYLLSIDLGIRTGFAVYGTDGRLSRYGSKNFGRMASLRCGIGSFLDAQPDLILIVMEGGGNIARVWEREARRRMVPTRRIHAERWRARLLHPSQRRSGPQAKLRAGDLARRINRWSGVPVRSSLRHDTSEAILVGFWAVIELGWLKDVPPELRDIPFCPSRSNLDKDSLISD